jgi:UDP-N-acetylglucosamine:LPS N-acetylglucosamine transferase
MEEERPDLVISVLPGINGLLAEATASIGAQLEVVLTDWHSVHRFWVAAGVHHYTTPTDSAREDCIRFGAAPESVDMVGIPLRRSFARPPIDRETERARRLTALGLEPDRFTILAMVGAEGSPRALANIAYLAQLEIDAQLIVVCGRNEQLRQRVQQLPSRVPVRAVGFVDYVAELMRSADVLVTKAGGLTLAEAFSSGVPVVIHDVLPGQEAGNLEYVLGQGAVMYAPTPPALVRIVTELCHDPENRSTHIKRASNLARPDAAAQIARNLVHRLNS